MFDNCTSPVLASTLDGFVTHQGHRAFHIKDVPGLQGGRHAADIEWIRYLREANETWIFLSGDGRILRNKAEAAALRSAGLIGFVLAPAYQKSPLHLQASTILALWPDILELARRLSPPAMFEIPLGKRKKLKQLAL